MSVEANPPDPPSATRGVAPPPPGRKLGPSVPRKARVSNPVVTAITCVLSAALGVVGGGITIGSAGVISGMRESSRRVFTEPFRSPVLFVALCAVAVLAACFWIRRLLRPRPPWALSLGFAYIAAVVAFVAMALIAER